MAERDAVDAPLYNTAAVVQRTSVPAATFRAWERRYGFPKPFREPSGQRLYSERDVQAIRWLEQQTEHGVSISRAIAMLREGYAQVAPGPQSTAPRSYEALQRDLSEALLGFDTPRAETVLSEAFALFPVEDVCLEVLEPVLVEVGDRWHAGTVSVAEEHYVTSFIRARLFALLNAYSPDDGEHLVLTACGPGEWHEIGILMVSVFLGRHGFRVRYLGPNLPIPELEEPLTRLRPSLLVLSAQSTDGALALRGVADVLGRVQVPPQFAYGGRAFNADPSLRSQVPGTYLGATARDAVATVRRLVRGHAADAS